MFETKFGKIGRNNGGKDEWKSYALSFFEEVVKGGRLLLNVSRKS